jgi:demethoxyubiquinone hydroxylase (CLK1/Coq7/Cat5 family)
VLVMRNYCFKVDGRHDITLLPNIRHTTLADSPAVALAALLPLLGCGEEAAALAFDGLSGSANVNHASANSLRAIAADERVHDALMRQLGRALPPVPRHQATLRVARRFHIHLGEGGAALHLARIAALDAAVCTVLSRLLNTKPLAADRNICAILARIRHDEARHVAVARTLTIATGNVRMLRDAAAAARGALASILMLEAESFDALTIDPDKLQRDISRLPDGLLPT